MLEEDSKNRFPNRARRADVFETKAEVTTGRVDLVPESGRTYILPDTLLLFEHNISYVVDKGIITSRFRKATFIGDGLLRLPDDKDISIQDLVPHQKVEVVLPPDTVDEQLKRDGLFEP